MTETTSININVKYLDSLLLKYYKEYFQDENIKLSREVYSDDFNGDSVTTIIARKVKIGNYSGEKRYSLTHDEIKAVLNQDLEEQGYSIEYFGYTVFDSKLINIEARLIEKQKVKQKTK